jgi:predicted SprT family Zn-dependent metalloprotease
MKDLQKLFKQCLRECDELGIEYGNIVEVTINTRAKKRWGQTCRRPDGFHINISSVLLRDDVSNEAAKDTIMHEILHTVDGCFDHKAKWQAMADKVNIYGYHVKRCTSAWEKGIDSSLMETTHHKTYIIRCEKCGVEVIRHRKSNFTEHPNWYFHGGCSGHFMRVE